MKIAGSEDAAMLLPFDYPPHWADRFYNEQYRLAMYLLGGGGQDGILLANAYVSRSRPLLNLLEPIWSSPQMAGARKSGGCFRLRRRGGPAFAVLASR